MRAGQYIPTSIYFSLYFFLASITSSWPRVFLDWPRSHVRIRMRVCTVSLFGRARAHVWGPHLPPRAGPWCERVKERERGSEPEISKRAALLHRGSDLTRYCVKIGAIYVYRARSRIFHRESRGAAAAVGTALVGARPLALSHTLGGFYGPPRSGEPHEVEYTRLIVPWAI